MRASGAVVRMVVGAAVVASFGTDVAAEAAVIDAGSGLMVGPRARGIAIRATGPDAGSMLGSRIMLGLPAFRADRDSLQPVTSRIVSARLLGDYYFTRPVRFERGLSGFRATSGLLLGSRLGTWMGTPPVVSGSSTSSIERHSFGLQPLPAPDAAGRDAEATAAVPYVGLGYSGAFDKGRWGVSADVGVMALRSNGAGLRVNRTLGGQSIDDALRDLRLAPMLQLGVSYSF